MCYVSTAVLHLYIDGNELPGDGSARVSITNITTDNRLSGLYCVDSSRVTGTDPDVYINWYLRDQRIERQSGGQFSGWSSLHIFYFGNQYLSLKRDPNVVVSEDVFSCRRGRRGRLFSSVSVGVYYPSKYACYNKMF